jgi:hypothetical protein
MLKCLVQGNVCNDIRPVRMTVVAQIQIHIYWDESFIYVRLLRNLVFEACQGMAGRWHWHASGKHKVLPALLSE